MNSRGMESKDWEGDGVLGKPYYSESETTTHRTTSLFAKHNHKDLDPAKPPAESLNCQEQVKEYFLSFLPPHVRRRGLGVPPFKVRNLRSLIGLL